MARRSRWVWIVVVMLVGAVAGTRPAAADIATPEGVKGVVKNERKEKGERVLDPVPGVRITATAASGAVAEGVTDAEGAFEIALPGGPGVYTIALDSSTLPKDVTLSVDAAASGSVEIRPSQILNRNFFTGKDTRSTRSRWGRLPQTIFDGLFFGLIIAICAVGLSLIYGATGLSNFTHGEMVTFGALVTWVANQRWGLNLVPAAVIGVAAGVLGGYALDRGLWEPLRKRRSGLTSQMIISIGLALFFLQLWTFLFGGRAKPYKDFQQQTDPIKLGPVEFPPRVLSTLLLCLAVLVGVAYFLMRTRFGKAVRAVSDNPDLASSTGINTDRIIRIVWLLGGGLAALGGVLLGLDQQVKFDSGAGLLLLMFAAITLGGLGSAFGALVGSLVIGLAVELWGWFFPTFADLKRVGALAALVIVLLVRPQGILGRKERVG